MKKLYKNIQEYLKIKNDKDCIYKNILFDNIDTLLLKIINKYRIDFEKENILKHKDMEIKNKKRTSNIGEYIFIHNVFEIKINNEILNFESINDVDYSKEYGNKYIELKNIKMYVLKEEIIEYTICKLEKIIDTINKIIDKLDRINRKKYNIFYIKK